MLLHLGGGHQNCAYPFGQVLHVRGKGSVLDEPVTVGTVVDDGQGLLESGSPDPNNICYQLADGNNDLRDTQM